MKKQMNTLKLTLLGAAVAVFGVGCASSGYARVDADPNDPDASVGGYAHTEMGSDSMAMNSGAPAANATVSALGRSVDTRADWVNRFPFYDYRLQTIETYTFAPDNDMRVSAQGTAPGFETDLPEGSVYVEAAGGSSSGVIRHTSNPTR